MTPPTNGGKPQRASRERAPRRELCSRSAGKPVGGLVMAHELQVDAAGLRTAAGDSELTATELTSDAVGGVSGGCPSQTGAAAILAAAQSARARQSGRISGQAENLSVSSARYDSTDNDGGAAITTVSV